MLNSIEGFSGSERSVACGCNVERDRKVPRAAATLETGLSMLEKELDDLLCSLGPILSIIPQKEEKSCLPPKDDSTVFGRMEGWSIRVGEMTRKILDVLGSIEI
jgi:hypothetical protein